MSSIGPFKYDAIAQGAADMRGSLSLELRVNVRGALLGIIRKVRALGETLLEPSVIELQKKFDNLPSLPKLGTTITLPAGLGVVNVNASAGYSGIGGGISGAGGIAGAIGGDPFQYARGYLPDAVDGALSPILDAITTSVNIGAVASFAGELAFRLQNGIAELLPSVSAALKLALDTIEAFLIATLDGFDFGEADSGADPLDWIRKFGVIVEPLKALLPK